MSTVATWRSLADQLTAEQIATIEYCERNNVPPGIACEESRIKHAEAYIAENRAQARCAHIPPPPDAVDEPSGWLPWDGDVAQRVYTCWSRQENGVSVRVLGYQYSDGRPIYRDIYIDGPDNCCDMTAERARALGQLLIEAADVLERLSDAEGTVPA